VSLKRGIEDKENKINELNIQIDNFENFITTSLNVLNQIQLKHRVTFRVLYFESFDFASSSLIVVSSSVLDTLSNLSAICLFPFLSSPCQKRIWQQTNLKVYLRHLMRQQLNWMKQNQSFQNIIHETLTKGKKGSRINF
jgi:hypothetical protein